MTSLLPALLVLALPSDDGGFAIESSTTCPSATEVLARLDDILPAARRPAGRVSITTSDNTLLIRYQSVAASNAIARQLLPGPDCSARAGAAAVIVAALITDVPSQSLPDVDLADTLRPTPALTDPLAVEVGAGLVGALAAPDATLGARADITIGRRSARSAFRLAMVATQAHHTPLAEGHVRWSRTVLAMTVCWRFVPEVPDVTFDAGPLVTLVFASGQGYAQDARDSSWTLGGTAGARIAWRWANFSLWADARVLVWPWSQHLRIQTATDGVYTTTDLPAWEGQLAVGIGFRAL